MVMEAILAGNLSCSKCGWVMMWEYSKKQERHVLYCTNKPCEEFGVRYFPPRFALIPAPDSDPFLDEPLVEKK
jgi:ssDNA-binding Zn-finger/Zn-ribbon topoisomerase 1